MNPINQLKEALLGAGLAATFKVRSYHPPEVYPKLADADSVDELLYKDTVLAIVTEATEIQQASYEDTVEGDIITFDEALDEAASGLLNEVQTRGLIEAIETSDVPLTPELIAMYMLSKDTVMRPARFYIETDVDVEGLPPVKRSALEILVPASFDVVRIDGESEADFHTRSVEAMALAYKAIMMVLE